MLWLNTPFDIEWRVLLEAATSDGNATFPTQHHGADFPTVGWGGGSDAHEQVPRAPWWIMGGTVISRQPGKAFFFVLSFFKGKFISFPDPLIPSEVWFLEGTMHAIFPFWRWNMYKYVWILYYSWEWTYPLYKRQFWRSFPIPKVGHLRSLEGQWISQRQLLPGSFAQTQRSSKGSMPEAKWLKFEGENIPKKPPV